MTSKKNKPQVAVVMGSDSDMPTMLSCIDTLKGFGVSLTVRIISAHRTPDVAADFADNAKANGIKVVIAAAGMAAHLAGALAGRTPLPMMQILARTNNLSPPSLARRRSSSRARKSSSTKASIVSGCVRPVAARRRTE